MASKSLPGVLGNDKVQLDVTNAEFETKDVGTDKTVTADLALSGDDHNNYELTSTTATTSADITALGITGSFTAADKTYDGTTDATVTGRFLSGVVQGDELALDGGTATFDTKDVGIGRTVTLSGATLTGDDKTNYTLTSVNDTTADITPASLTITASSHDDVVLGSDAPTVVPLFDGFVAGESFAHALSKQPTCGTDYTAGDPVGPYGTECAGAEADNYTIAYEPGSFRVVFGWDGFLQPVNNTAHQTGVSQSKFKLGQKVPLRFELRDASGNVVQQTGNPMFSRSAYRSSCDPGATLETSTTEPATNGDEYKQTGSTYHYNWDTKGLKAGVYRVHAELADGTQQWTDICLTK